MQDIQRLPIQQLLSDIPDQSQPTGPGIAAVHSID